MESSFQINKENKTHEDNCGICSHNFTSPKVESNKEFVHIIPTISKMEAFNDFSFKNLSLPI